MCSGPCEGLPYRSGCDQVAGRGRRADHGAAVAPVGRGVDRVIEGGVAAVFPVLDPEVGVVQTGSTPGAQGQIAVADRHVGEPASGGERIQCTARTAA